MELKDRVSRLMVPAYLCAAGDAKLAEEEVNDLFEIRPTIFNILQAREAIEKYIETDDFDAAMGVIGSSENPLSYSLEDFNLLGGLPPDLADIHEARSAIKTEEELLALYRAEALKIVDPFEQDVALLAMTWVGESDGELSDGESFVCDYFESDQCWNLNPNRPFFMHYAISVISGREIPRPNVDDYRDM